jgi:hypothetical protein
VLGVWLLNRGSGLGSAPELGKNHTTRAARQMITWTLPPPGVDPRPWVYRTMYPEDPYAPWCYLPWCTDVLAEAWAAVAELDAMFRGWPPAQVTRCRWSRGRAAGTGALGLAPVRGRYASHDAGRGLNGADHPGPGVVPGGGGNLRGAVRGVLAECSKTEFAAPNWILQGYWPETTLSG